MQISHINTVTFHGTCVKPVCVQGTIIRGIPSFSIVGLPGKSISESKHRVKSGLANSGFQMPFGSIIINLTPAGLYKEGSYFDLPIATSLVYAKSDFNPLKNCILVGELGLDGKVLPVSGILAICQFCLDHNLTLVLPHDQISVASLLEGLNIIPISSLNQILSNTIPDPIKTKKCHTLPPPTRKFATILGQQAAKRAIAIAAAGKHNILMTGPPGVGKTMLAKQLYNLLPSPTQEEIISINKINTLLDQVTDIDQIITSPPFRAPHHSCTVASMIGGGNSGTIRPGEASLANKGILFLDELPEFNIQVIESLREPLENHSIHISRAKSFAEFECDFQLVAAMNPCRCPNIGNQTCINAPGCEITYKNKISGPILDRIDIHIKISNNISHDSGPDINTTFNKINNAVDIQLKRQGSFNARIQFNAKCIEKCAHNALDLALKTNRISYRGMNKILGIARTIADLEQEDSVLEHHIFEAISYRPNF